MIIQEEIIEKYLMGEASFAEKMLVELAAKKDAVLAERLLVMKRFQKMAEVQEREKLPLERMAAKSEDNLCDILCERFILRRFYPDMERTLWTDAKEEQAFLDGLLKLGNEAWLTEKGMALYNIGRILELGGLSTSRRFLCEIDDLVEAIGRSEEIIAVVNKDILMGKEGEGLPDHAVCVLTIKDDTVCLFNPSTEKEMDEYPVGVFLRAWETSRRYAVFADRPEKKVYDPHVLKLVDRVELDEGLTDLGEALAEFVHDMWAEKRIGEGYVYGPENNSDLAKGPLTNKDLKPYSDLSEEEKEYDRDSSMKTLKLLIYLGYIIEKKTEEGHVCPVCGNGIRLEWTYCAHCGRFLELSDFRKKMTED